MNKKFFRIILTIVISLGLLTPVAAQVTPPWDPFFASPTLVANLGSAYRPFGIAVVTMMRMVMLILLLVEPPGISILSKEMVTAHSRQLFNLDGSRRIIMPGLLPQLI